MMDLHPPSSQLSYDVLLQAKSSFLGLLGLDSLLGGIGILLVLLDSEAGHLLGECLPVLGMAHGVDDGVQARGGLGHEAGDLQFSMSLVIAPSMSRSIGSSFTWDIKGVMELLLPMTAVRTTKA